MFPGECRLAHRLQKEHGAHLLRHPESPTMQRALCCVSFLLLSLPVHADTVVEHATEEARQLEALRKGRVHFGFDEDVVRPGDRDQLAQAAAFLKVQPGMSVVVAGHADERGTEEYNMALAERRARAVATYLQDFGVPSQRVQTVSFGENQPLAEGHDEDTLALNRRVEFNPNGTLRPLQMAATTAPPAAPIVNEGSAGGAPAATQTTSAQEGGGRGRFPILPMVGAALMVGSVGAVIASLPFIASVVALGPSAWSAPAQCREPVSAQNGSMATNPLQWCGSGWSVAMHGNERTYGIPALGVGVVGALLLGGPGLVIFSVGALLVASHFMPTRESDPQQ